MEEIDKLTQEKHKLQSQLRDVVCTCLYGLTFLAPNWHIIIFVATVFVELLNMKVKIQQTMQKL